MREPVNLCFYLLLITLFLYKLNVSASFEANIDGIEQGKAQLESLKSWSQLPNYGSCWTSAIHQLTDGCRRLDDVTHARLALQFSGCFLQSAGLPSPRCDVTDDVTGCLSGLDSRQFDTYREFFTHTQNMCSFLQAQVWQEAASRTVRELSSGAAAMAARLEESGSVQSDILQAQKLSLKNQHLLVEHGQQVAKQVDAWRDGVANMVQDFRERTAEHRDLILTVFNQLGSLQQLVLDRFSWFNGLFYYTCGVLLAYLVTSAPRTADARVWLFVLLTLNLAAERLLAGYLISTSSAQLNTAEQINAAVESAVRLTRHVTVCVGLLVVTVCVYRYRDLNVVNYTLLQQLHQQHAQLHAQLSSMGMLKPSVDLSFTSETVSDGISRRPTYMYGSGDTIDSPSNHRCRDSELGSLIPDVRRSRLSLTPSADSPSRPHSPYVRRISTDAQPSNCMPDSTPRTYSTPDAPDTTRRTCRTPDLPDSTRRTYRTPDVPDSTHGSTPQLQCVRYNLRSGRGTPDHQTPPSPASLTRAVRHMQEVTGRDAARVKRAVRQHGHNGPVTQ